MLSPRRLASLVLNRACEDEISRPRTSAANVTSKVINTRMRFDRFPTAVDVAEEPLHCQAAPERTDHQQQRQDRDAQFVHM